MNVRTIIITMTATLLTACGRDTVPGNIEPKIVVYDATDVTRTEATLHGEVTLQGSTEMPELHFVYAEVAIGGGRKEESATRRRIAGWESCRTAADWTCARHRILFQPARKQRSHHD